MFILSWCRSNSYWWTFSRYTSWGKWYWQDRYISVINFLLEILYHLNDEWMLADKGKGTDKQGFADKGKGTDKQKLFAGASTDIKPTQRTAEEVKAKYRKTGVSVCVVSHSQPTFKVQNPVWVAATFSCFCSDFLHLHQNYLSKSLFR